MSIVKETKIDRIEIVGEYKNLQVREKISILENGKEISSSFHRYILSPEHDLNNQTDEIKKICEVVWTDEIKTAYTMHIKQCDENLKQLIDTDSQE